MMKRMEQKHWRAFLFIRFPLSNGFLHLLPTDFDAWPNGALVTVVYNCKLFLGGNFRGCWVGDRYYKVSNELEQSRSGAKHFSCMSSLYLPSNQ